MWIERNGKPILGKGRAALLGEIQRTGSLQQAAAKFGMSYRHAWGEMRRMEEAAGSPLVASTRGGKGGGTTRLTETGRALLEMYARAESETSHLNPDSRDGIPCVVVRISQADSEVVLHSEENEGLTITVTGSDLAKRASVGDRMMLMRL